MTLLVLASRFPRVFASLPAPRPLPRCACAVAGNRKSEDGRCWRAESATGRSGTRRTALVGIRQEFPAHLLPRVQTRTAGRASGQASGRHAGGRGATDLIGRQRRRWVVRTASPGRERVLRFVRLCGCAVVTRVRLLRPRREGVRNTACVTAIRTSAWKVSLRIMCIRTNPVSAASHTHGPCVNDKGRGRLGLPRSPRNRLNQTHLMRTEHWLRYWRQPVPGPGCLITRTSHSSESQCASLYHAFDTCQ